MLQLIRNELQKLLSKKSVLILLFIIFCYVLITNFLYDNNSLLVTERNASITIIRNFYYEYDVLIIISILILICPIISSEYQNRTIKNLLLIPKSRTKIIISKYICILICLIFLITIIFINQLIISLFFDHWSLKDIIIFNDKLYSCFSWFINTTLYRFLYYYLLASFVFFFSTLCHSNGTCIIMSIIFYISNDFFKSLLLEKNFICKNYLWFMNWDLESQFINGILNIKNIIIVIIYCLLLLLLSVYFFNKKEIKNL